MRQFFFAAMLWALATGAGACDDGGDAPGSDTDSGATTDGGPGGAGYVEGALTTCDEACAYIGDCHGFEDEAFGQDLISCRDGCSTASAGDLQVVLDCLNGTACSAPQAIAACDPDQE